MHDKDLAIPILPCQSLPRTVAFYGRLGFAGEVVGDDAAYAILRRGDVEIHFFLHPDLVPSESFAGCYLRVGEVGGWYEDARAASLPASGIPRLVALEDKPWRMREFAVVDEDGNLLRVGQEL